MIAKLPYYGHGLNRVCLSEIQWSMGLVLSVRHNYSNYP